MVKPRYERKNQHGFIEFVLNSASSELDIQLIATGHDGLHHRFSLIEKQRVNKSIFFNSYFLDDGEYCIHFNARNIQGGLLETLVDCYNITNGYSGLSNELRAGFRANPSLALSNSPLDSSYFRMLPAKLLSDNYPKTLREVRPPAGLTLTRADISTFDEKGIVILEGFFDRATIDSAKSVLTQVNENELHSYKRGSSQRLVNLHQSYDQLNTLYSNKHLYDVVSDLFGAQAYPCQSLTFINGSTQDPHQDTVHLTSFPRGLMCGIWIALEDVVPGAGELIFYPGSHTLPAILCSTHNIPKVDPEVGDYTEFGNIFTPKIKDILASNPQLQSQQFLAKAGDVLIWQENLIHGGAPRILQNQTRMSMVIHAFAEPALIYYDSLGMSGKRDTFLN